MSLRRTLPARLRQRGAALLAAMLTVTLVAGFAVAALWQQWQAAEVEAAERARVQASWILTGSLDWARLILIEDGRSAGADHLGEPWAVALQESRLSSFLAADKTNTGAQSEQDQLDVFLSGQIADMQGRLNVTNLADAGVVSPTDVAIFGRLFELLGLPQGELVALAANVARANLAATSSASAGTPGVAGSSGSSGSSGATGPLRPQRIDQLEWLGLSRSSLEALRPYISLLPARTPINLNTAGAEVIYASVEDLDLAQAQRLVEERATRYFTSVADADGRLGPPAGRINPSVHSVQTRFFEVRGRLRLDDVVIEERSLVQRDLNPVTVKTLWRERAALPVVADATNTGGGEASAAGNSSGLSR